MLIFSLYLLSQAASATVTAPVTAAEINALALKIRGHKPRDEFDALPSQPSLNGRRFVVELEPWGTKPPRIACFGYPMWSYSAETQTLYVSPGGGDLGLIGFSGRQGMVSKDPANPWGGRAVRYYATSCERKALPSYTATNAYGATFEIDPTAQIITAIADDHIRPEWPGSFKLQISGDAARALVDHLKVRLTGELRDWKPGVAIACDVRRDGPTASSPYDRTRNLCVANGRVEKFEVIDARNGRVLHSESRPQN